MNTKDDYRCNNGHNFTPFQLIATNEAVIFCSQCGEIRPLTLDGNMPKVISNVVVNHHQ